MSILHSFRFNGQGGYSPFAGVILGTTGDIFGTTLHGGLPGCINQIGCGTVFQLTPNPDGSWTERTLHHFTGGEDGGNPFSGLIMDSKGDLLGTSWGNGIIPCEITCGTVFRLSPNADSNRVNFEVLHRFEGSDGAGPVGSLIFDAAGNLYGTTQAGGASDDGVVFEIMP
jgi:uncharacterized repeat protein (TIGR03803 family)